MTAPDVTGALRRLLDLAKTQTPAFEVSRLGEFKSAPPKALCFALWGERIGVSPVGSGLATSNAMLTCTARIYFPLTHRPEDEIELRVLAAASAYLGQINRDFTLGDTVRDIDLLGETGEPPTWVAGHVNIDNQLYRIADLEMRIIFNDSWEQGGA